MRINSNILSLQATRNLSQTSKALARSLERLASGRRINRAGDDAAGLAISTRLDSQIRGLARSVRNINDAFGLLATAEGALATQTDIVQRMRELALQASNGTMGATDRSYLDQEMQQLLEEFFRIAEQTEFNGRKLLDGSISDLNLQVGNSSGETIGLNIGSSLADSIFIYERGDGSFSQASTLSVGTYPFSASQMVDLNGDGNVDILQSNKNFGNISVFLGNGDGSFTQTTTVGVGGYPYWTPQVADLNGDGNLDFLQTNASDKNISIRLGNGDGTFSVAASLNLSQYPASQLQLADFDEDGNIDLVQTAPGLISICLGNGDGSFSIASTIAVSSYSFLSPRVADLDGDGHLDILQNDTYSTGAVSILLGNGDGSFSFAPTVNVGNYPWSTPEVADLNEDGRLDILQTNDDGTISVRLGNGDGTFSVVADVTVGTGPRSTPRIVDLDNDGHLDIVQTNDSSEDMSIRLGNGDGTFSIATTLEVSGLPSSRSQVVDMNGDGNLDILQANRGGGDVSIFFGNGDGSFTTGATLTAGLGPIDTPQVADLNGDGVLDIVQTNVDSSDISIFLQNTEWLSAVDELSLASQSDAQDTLEIFDRALSTITEQRASLGAMQNRLEYSAQVTSISVDNLSLARSQILDADFAEETAELTRAQIMQQAGVAVLAQANSQMQIVLGLLQF